MIAERRQSTTAFCTCDDTLPVLPVNSEVNLLAGIGLLATANLADHSMDEGCIKRVLQQLAQLFQATVQSLITLKGGTENMSGQREVADDELELPSRRERRRRPPQAVSQEQGKTPNTTAAGEEDQDPGVCRTSTPLEHLGARRARQ